MHPSDSHRHEDVPGLELGIGIFGAHLAGRLRVFELEPNFAFVAQRLEEVDDVGGVEAHQDRVAGVGRVDGVFALAGLGGTRTDLELVALEAEADRSGTLIGKLRHALNG